MVDTAQLNRVREGYHAPSDEQRAVQRSLERGQKNKEPSAFTEGLRVHLPKWLRHLDSNQGPCD